MVVCVFKSNHYKKPNCLTPLTLSINIVAGPEVSDGAHEVVDCAQTRKFCNGPIGPLSQRIQSLSVSALSLEEQKILQSLERLNQRLQCQFHLKSCAFNPHSQSLYVYHRLRWGQYLLILPYVCVSCFNVSKCQQLFSWSLPLDLTDVQNTAGGNPAVRGIFTLGPAFVSIAHVFRGSDLFPWNNVTCSQLCPLFRSSHPWRTRRVRL